MVKICPRSTCRMVNIPNALECESCGRDMTKVLKIDEDLIAEDGDLKTENETKAVELETNDVIGTKEEDLVGDQRKYFRLCDCGHHNPTSIRKCEDCGESLVGIEMTEEVISSTNTLVNDLIQPRARINAEDGGLQLDLELGTTILGRGREGGQYLSQKTYVSGTHAAITVNDQGIFIEDLNSTNGTYVNGVKIGMRIATKIKSGDIVGLGGNHSNQVNAAFLALTID